MKRIVVVLGWLLSGIALAQTADMPERKRENLMVVVRESAGANRADDALVPMGKVKVKRLGDREAELDLAYWHFIGDTHIRFVFDGPQMTMDATPQDLKDLGIKRVDDALALALINLKRVSGLPAASPLEGGVMSVEGQLADFNSSYFLDRAYWLSLLKNHPEGLVVGLPKRGALFYVPAADAKAVDALKRSIADLYASSERLRVSSALFLFKDGKWSVFQPPHQQ